MCMLLCVFVFCAVHSKKICTWAAETALKIIVNNYESNLKPIESDGVLFVPLSFPVEEGKSTWEVSVEYDKTKGTVKIQKNKFKIKQREKTKCPRCTGSKKCQACYPAGSGKTATDKSCPVCDGTGKCFYCDGKGEY